jgi:hypothetical protein
MSRRFDLLQPSPPRNAALIAACVRASGCVPASEIDGHDVKP